MRDLLEWAVPTAEDHREHGHEGHGRDEGPLAAIQDQEDVRADRTMTNISLFTFELGRCR